MKTITRNLSFFIVFLMTIFFWSSCITKEEKFKKLISDYELEGKDIIVKSDTMFYFIYSFNDGFWIKYLDGSDKKLFDKDTQVNIVNYWLDFDKNGKPIVDTTIYEKKLSPLFWKKTKKENLVDSDVLPYDKRSFKIFDNEAIYFTYEFVIQNPNPEIYKDTYICYFANPTTIYSSNLDFEEMSNLRIKKRLETYGNHNINYRMDKIKLYAGGLATSLQVDRDFFPYIFGYNYTEGGTFEWIININNEGLVVSNEPYISYKNNVYEIPEIDRFPLSCFETREGAENVLQEILQGINRQKIKEIEKNAITLELLNNESRNELKFENEYLNKYFDIKCNVEYIEKVSGFFEPDEYRYKVGSKAVVIMGAWWSDYDLIIYTNDDSFTKLTYPRDIIFRGRLYYGDGRKFKFKDGELLVY